MIAVLKAAPNADSAALDKKAAVLLAAIASAKNYYQLPKELRYDGGAND
jgi:hypothetical protein